MTWFRVDDQFSTHPKARAAGLHGRGLWLAAGTACAMRNTDGLVAALVAKDAAYHAEVELDAAVASLVASGLWHDVVTIRRCDRCKDAVSRLEVKKLAKGEFFYHDWTDYQLTRDVAKMPAERVKHNRKKALYRDHELCAAIRSRDRDRCRYCDVRVDFKDRVSDLGGQYDHVDPEGPNSLENVVVACRGCNNEKGQRSPIEAGMPLHDPLDEDSP